MILSTIFSFDKKVCEQIQSHPIHEITYCWLKIFYVDVVYEKEQKNASWKLWIQTDIIDYGYVWFPENLRENARERKYKGKVEGK